MRAAVALLLLGPLLPAARAGGGPETTLVIVNADSPVSRRVANEYIALRKIPATNLVYLPDIPGRTVIEVDVFRRRIWKPVLAYLEQHGLANRIETIAYSADFPYGVDFRADAGRAGPAVGSLTGLTFLADRVMHKDLRYAALQSNPYFQPVGGPARRAATDEERQIYMEAFMAVKAGNLRRAAQLYGRFCESFPEHAEAHYNRACCLARLNRNEDALAALRAAVEAGWSDSGHTERDADLAGLRSLPEFRGIVESMGKRAAEAPPALGFAAARKEAGGALDRTYLAVMLGYTGVRGNSVPEILTYLRAAAMSDGTRPEGTVYICKNGDIRSRTREPFFASTVAALQRLGRRAEILEPGKDGQTGVLPVGKKDVIGAVIGKAGFSWKSSNSRILPGAICEHLTSFGAAFRSPGQTKLSELLRYGAAGTSGTVVEPMAIWRKFPHPFLHAYYAEGCSLAEAFYQSVAGPYQLLIVGDPLARPFAHFARAKLDKPSDLLPWKGKVRIQARVEPAENRAVARVELWVDGRFITEAKPDDPLVWDTTSADDGFHDLRVVAVEDSRVGTRSLSRTRIQVSNAGRSVTLTRMESVGAGHVSRGGTAVGASRVELLRGTEVLARAPVRNGSWSLRIPVYRIGPGAAEDLFVVRAHFGEGPGARSLPFRPVGRRTGTWPAAKADPKPTLPGLRARVTTAPGEERSATVATLGDERGRSLRRDLAHDVEEKIQNLNLEGQFQVHREGWYQLSIRSRGSVRIQLDGMSLPSAGGSSPGVLHFSVQLAKGWHGLLIELEPSGPPDLTAHLGGEQVTVPLDATNTRHVLVGRAVIRNEPRATGKAGDLGALTDGDRRKPAARDLGEGVTLSWKRTVRRLTTVVLFPAPGRKDSPPWPAAWVVETSTGRKWRPVQDLRTVAGRPPRRAPGRNEIPLWVELSFDPVAVRKLRVRSRDPNARAALAEVEVYARGRR